MSAVATRPVHAQARWRSMLFVPANHRRRIDSAHKRGADALILDLEDAVPDAQKAAARDTLPFAIAQLSSLGATCTVRVNADALREDLSAAMYAGLAAIVVPKVEDPGTLQAIDALMLDLERRRGLATGSVGVIALIESPVALFRLQQIAEAPRLIGLAMGSEDFSMALGVKPTSDSLTLPCQWIALAAAANRLMAFGSPTSLANFEDLEAYRVSAERARRMGMSGALCIHPSQLAIVNDAFSPSAGELAWARAVMQVWSLAERSGFGVAALNGAMIDKPVAQRALAMLRQYGEGTEQTQINVHTET